jgi:hypothetical protein
MRILLDTKKHSFINIVNWVYENMPKDTNENRWRFIDTHVVDESLATDKTLPLHRTETYIEFDNDKDAILFTLRWS